MCEREPAEIQQERERARIQKEYGEREKSDNTNMYEEREEGGGGGRTGEQRERTGEQSEYTDYREREAQRLTAHIKPGDFGKWDSSTQGRLVVTE